MIVKFDEDDVEFVRAWAQACNAKKTQDKKIDATQTDEFVSCMGKFGEIAAGRALGTFPNFDITVGGDGGNDLEAWGLTWQIKTSSIRKLIFNSLDEFSSDAAILVHLISGKEKMFELPHFHVLGGISKTKFEKQHYKHDFGYGMRAVCDLDHLTALDTIKAACGVSA